MLFNLSRTDLLLFFLVLSTLQVLYSRGNQVNSSRHGANNMVVHIPGNLPSFLLLDSHHIRSKNIQLSFQLGPHRNHVLSAKYFPCEVQSILPWCWSVRADRWSHGSLASEMCNNVISLLRYVEVRHVSFVVSSIINSVELALSGARNRNFCSLDI